MPFDNPYARTNTPSNLDAAQDPVWTVVLVLVGPGARPGQGGTYFLRASDAVHALATARAHWFKDYGGEGYNPAQLIPALISKTDCRDANASMAEARQAEATGRLAMLTAAALGGEVSQLARSLH